MPQTAYRHYRDTATMLWLVGALLLGLAAAAFLDADRKQTLFYIIFAVGGTLLIRLRGSSRRVSAALPPPQQQDLLEELVAGPRLNADQSREWLDRLLVTQQENETK